MSSRKAHPRKRGGFKPRSLYLWHRYLGLSAALFASVLAITGILLNHTEGLRLDERYISADWLLRWYGIAPPKLQSARAGTHWLSLVDGRLYVDTTATEVTGDTLRGSIEDAGLYMTLIDATLVLHKVDGTVIEQRDLSTDLSAAPEAIGRRGEQIAVRTAGVAQLSDSDLLSWTAVPDDRTIAWSTTAPPPAYLATALQSQARAHTLPLERVILDLHSGRILGTLGVVIMDTAAAGLLLLAASGSWLWWRQKRKHRH